MSGTSLGTSAAGQKLFLNLSPDAVLGINKKEKSILEEVEAACDRAVPIGAKRKPQLLSTLSLQGVHLKLQKLEVS